MQRRDGLGRAQRPGHGPDRASTAVADTLRAPALNPAGDDDGPSDDGHPGRGCQDDGEHLEHVDHDAEHLFRGGDDGPGDERGDDDHGQDDSGEAAAAITAARAVQSLAGHDRAPSYWSLPRTGLPVALEMRTAPIRTASPDPPQRRHRL